MMSLSIDGKKPVGSLVGRLLHVSCPSAIRYPSVCFALFAMAAGVIPIDVSTINRPAMRALTHVREEIRKGIIPSRANTDATTAVMLPRWVVRLITPSFKSTPACIRRSAATMPVHGFRFRAAALATAVTCYSAAKLRGQEFFFPSAIAAANENNSKPTIWCSPHGYQFSEAFAASINKGAAALAFGRKVEYPLSQVFFHIHSMLRTQKGGRLPGQPPFAFGC